MVEGGILVAALIVGAHMALVGCTVVVDITETGQAAGLTGPQLDATTTVVVTTE